MQHYNKIFEKPRNDTAICLQKKNIEPDIFLPHETMRLPRNQEIKFI